MELLCTSCLIDDGDDKIIEKKIVPSIREGFCGTRVQEQSKFPSKTFKNR